MLGKIVVVDLISSYVCLGDLVGRDAKFLELRNADLHDLRDSSATREIYVHDSVRLGIRRNRARCWFGVMRSWRSRDSMILRLIDHCVNREPARCTRNTRLPADKTPVATNTLLRPGDNTTSRRKSKKTKSMRACVRRVRNIVDGTRLS